jgi:hypothetical protein
MLLSETRKHTLGRDDPLELLEKSDEDQGHQAANTKGGQPSARMDHPASQLASSLYIGQIGHFRLRPVQHHFTYSIYMAMIDLDEVDKIFNKPLFCSKSRFSLIQFRRNDYLGGESGSLADSVRQLVYQHCGIQTEGPIRMLTHLRYFGFTFNPVTFYYCYAKDGRRLQAIVADVTNTPWGERYSYVIPCPETMTEDVLHQCEKQFHVSPFMPLSQQYQWRTSAPGSGLRVTIENHDTLGQIFRADLNLKQRSFSYRQLVLLLIRFPFMTVKVVLAIYWQAFRLWLKRVPYVPHPKAGQ